MDLCVFVVAGVVAANSDTPTAEGSADYLARCGQLAVEFIA